MTEITWKKYEEDMHSEDVETSRKATEAFVEERDLQTKTSKAAREWEADRKEEITKNKPKVTKDRLQKQDDKVNKSWNLLLKAGTFTSDLIPAPGYVLIGVDNEDTTTDSGIIVTQPTTDSNEGIVLETGKSLVVGDNIVECPVKKGDKILFKRGAGLELTIKEKQTKLIYFPDILGVFV